MRDSLSATLVMARGLNLIRSTRARMARSVTEGGDDFLTMGAGESGVKRGDTEAMTERRWVAGVPSGSGGSFCMIFSLGWREVFDDFREDSFYGTTPKNHGYGSRFLFFCQIFG